MNAEFPVRRTKTLLRDIPRQLYMKGDGDWTADPDEAMDFSDVTQLLAACDLYGVRDAEVVEHVASGVSEVQIRFDSRPAEPPKHC